jgi:hypothetical protein
MVAVIMLQWVCRPGEGQVGNVSSEVKGGERRRQFCNCRHRVRSIGGSTPPFKVG